MREKTNLTTRDRILAAASRVLVAHGAEALTLDAAAAEAGVSKGGLLHHFRSKDALIGGMVEHFLRSFEARIAEREAVHGDWRRAYVEASFDGDPLEDAATTAMLAAIAIKPALMTPLRERYAEWARRFSERSRDPVLAELMRLALDGLWANDLFALAPPGSQARAALRARLLALLEEDSPS